MAELLQIILINLAVSCDNVGVIALATRDLAPQKALTARRLGIWLSLALKILFVGITGFLFSIPWLHIRIIGGVMLIYVTWNMLRQNRGREGRQGGGDSFLFAMLSIIAADVSMSLDNVIAILSIVTVDGGAPDSRDMVLIVVGLAACVPVLLWFSGAISSLMERFLLLTYLCAGYLVFIAVRMIFEDATIDLFLRSINFQANQSAAALLGILVVLASLFTAGAKSTHAARRRRGMVTIYFFVVLYSLVTVGVISFLGTNPVIDGIPHSVELVYGFSPQGVHAVFTIGASPFLFTLCASIFVGIVMDAPDRDWPQGYRGRLARCMGGMAVLILLELLVSTVGLTASFGFGRMHPGAWLLNLLMQLLLHCTYVSVFCMIWTFARSRAATVVFSMLLLLLETVVVDICLLHRSAIFIASFLPDYYIVTLPDQLVSAGLLLRVVLVAVLCIGASSFVGSARYGWIQGNSPAPLRNWYSRAS